MRTFVEMLNGLAAHAPVFVIGASGVAVAIAPRLRLLQFPGLVVKKRKAGSH